MASDEVQNQSLGEESDIGKLARILRTTRVKANKNEKGLESTDKRVDEVDKQTKVNAKKITLLKNILKKKDENEKGKGVGSKLPGSEKEKTGKEVNSINKNILAINKNLIAITNLIEDQAAQERKSDRAEAKKARSDDDRDKKINAENFLEKGMDKMVISPLKKMKEKANGPFDRLMKAMEALFMGWLGIKGLDALEAWGKGDTEALEKIKGDIVKGLAIAGGIALATQVGISAVTSVITGIITKLLFSIPKLLGLMANPYVWLGVLAVYGGIKLFDILKASGANFVGAGSFSDAKQATIAMVGSKGKAATLAELQLRTQQLLQENPDFDPDNILDTTFSSIGSQYLELQQQIKQLNEGIYDFADPSLVTDKDKQIIENITARISELSKSQKSLNDVTSRIDALTKVSGKLPSELTGSDKAMYDALFKTKSSLEKSILDLQRKIRKMIFDDLSDNGQNFFDNQMRVAGVDPDMFSRRLSVGGLFDIGGIGDVNTAELKNLDKLTTTVNTNLGITPKPEITSTEEEGEISRFTMPKGAFDFDSTKEAVKLSRAAFAGEISIPDLGYEIPNFTINPVALFDESEDVSTTQNGTDYPTNLSTFNPWDANLGFAELIYGTP
jgi:hypothetical protein